MSMQWPKAGPNDVASYSVSAVPWVTSSVLQSNEVRSYLLPAVSRYIHLRNVGAVGELKLGFSTNGINGNPPSHTHYLTVSASQALPVLELRVKEIFLKASSGTPSFELLVGLTNIKSDNFPVLTGSVTSSFELFSGIG